MSEEKEVKQVSNQQPEQKGEDVGHPDTEVKAESRVSKKPEKKKRRRPGFKLLITFISMINLLILGSIFWVLSATKDKAIELKTLRNTAIGAEEKGKVEVGDLEIESTIQRYDYLKALFPDEVGLIEFVKLIETLKAEGTVKDFSFANQDAVRDKTKVLGIPFILRFIGSWNEVNGDLIKLQEFPYLTRAVTWDIRVSGEPEKQIDLRYGGFIYVDESLEKNK